MKKIISLLLVLSIISSVLTGCQLGADNGEDNKEESNEPISLAGKSIIFIGNSYTHYGNVVIRKEQSVRSQYARSFDAGYFYQLCKGNGAEVNVTNWCYGGHTLSHLFEVCSADRGCDGVIHKDDIINKYYDYVVIQGTDRSQSVSELLDTCEMVMDFFREDNPDVKFVFLVPEQAHTAEYLWLPGVKELENKGVTVVDWGKLVYDLINGNVSVPNATQSYNKNSFIVCKSETDGYHPNILTGYITALMTYCAITGESAVGQDYSFCDDTNISDSFDFDRFKRWYYTYQNPTTNFVEIFESPSDMEGIQELIDRCIEEKAYLKY